MHYKGWIPTVNGRLSYKLIGQTEHPSACVTLNKNIHQTRFILSEQERNLNDALFNYFRFTRNIGKFKCVLIASVSENSVSSDIPLTGSVFFFWAGKKKSYSEPTLRKIQKYKRLLGANLNSLIRKRVIKNVIQLNMAPLCAALQSESSFSADIALHRNGILTIFNLKVNDDDELRNSQHIFRKKEDIFEDYISNQIYYYLRDISHIHQHHYESHDTFLKSHRITAENKLEWSSNIIFSLYHHIIRLKRKRSRRRNMDALGVLAYLQSFKHIIKKMLKDNNKVYNNTVPYFFDDTLQLSMEATKERIHIELAEKEMYYSNIRTYFFTITGLILSFVTAATKFSNPNTPKDSYVVTASNYFVEHVSSILIICITLPLLWWIVRKLYYNLASGKWSISNWIPIRDLARLLWNKNPYIKAFVFFFIAIVILIATLKMTALLMSTTIHDMFESFF